jgi:hypothetical protein
MLVTPHALVGATTGVLIPARWAAVPLSFGSHFLLDTVPHWQETLSPYTPHRGTWARVPVDLALAVILTRWIARRSDDRTRVWCAALAGVIPDLDFVWFLAPDAFERLGAFRRYVAWHAGIQRETSHLGGLAPQLGVIAFCGVWLRTHQAKER